MALTWRSSGTRRERPVSTALLLRPRSLPTAPARLLHTCSRPRAPTLQPERAQGCTQVPPAQGCTPGALCSGGRRRSAGTQSCPHGRELILGAQHPDCTASGLPCAGLSLRIQAAGGRAGASFLCSPALPGRRVAGPLPGLKRPSPLTTRVPGRERGKSSRAPGDSAWKMKRRADWPAVCSGSFVAV